MAQIDPADVQLPPQAVVRRQRFYFLRHGQSVNNLYSLHDEVREPSEEADFPEQQLAQHQRQHPLWEQQGESQQQHKQQQRLPYSEDSCSQQLDQGTLEEQQPQPSLHHKEQPHQNLRVQKVRQKQDQRPLQQCHESQKQPRSRRQKRLSPHSAEESLPATPCALVEAQRSGRPTGRVSDPSLTEVGRRQAAAAARWVQRHVQQMLVRPQTGKKRRQQLVQHAYEGPPSPAVKKIVCSPMRRAVETAAELRKVFTVDVYVHPLLFEQGGLFSGPRKVAPSTAILSTSVTTAAAPDGGTTGASCSSEALQPTGGCSSEISVTGGAAKVQREVCANGSAEGREAVAPSRTETASSRRSSGAGEGLTLQEVKAMLPDVKVIIPTRGFPFWKQDFCASRGDSDEEAACAAAGCSTSSTTWRSPAQEKMASGTTKTCEPEKGTRLAGVHKSRLLVQGIHQSEVAAEAGGGHYCEEWMRGGRSWWCGGREKLVDTVARAAEIVSWMQNECLIAQETGGSVLMVMHGLMMDLIMKALMFPFPSASSACPYLDLLAQSLRAHEVATGKPFYNMPQQTAYFTSSNCSFCCFELAAAAPQQPAHLSGHPAPRAGVHSGVNAPLQVTGFKADSTCTVADRSMAGSGNGTASVLLRGGDQLRRRHSQHEHREPCGDSVDNIGAARFDVSATTFVGFCRSAKGATDVAAGRTVRYKDGSRVLATSAVELGDPKIVTESSKKTLRGGVALWGCRGKDTADPCLVRSSTQSGTAEAAAPAASTTALDAATSLTRLVNPAPALVSALIEWNVPAVDPQLYSGQSLGASIIMSC